MIDSTKKTANYLQLGLLNINSFKECSEDRTTELNTIFRNSKAHIFIITETETNERKKYQIPPTLPRKTMVS